MNDTHRTWTRVNGHGSYWQDAIAEDGQIVARVIGGGYPTGVGWSLDAEQRANLMRAAPDMLAAMRDALSASDANDGDSLMNAIAAFRPIIAKATGATDQ